MTRDSAPARTSLPLLTLLLVGANLWAYFLELKGGGLPVCYDYGFVPAAPSIDKALSSLFLHDPSTMLHLGGNMAFLAVFGVVVERALGHVAFLSLYGLAGVAGAFLHAAVDPSATTPLVGASGAVFGVMAVAGVLRPRLLGFVVAFAGIEIWRAFSGDGVDVSFGCHLGGLAAGALVATVLRAVGSEALEAA